MVEQKGLTMIRRAILVILLVTTPIAPAAAVIAIAATPRAVAEAPPRTVRAAEAPAAENSGWRFGELAAAGLGVLVLFLAFSSARMPPSVTS